MMDFARFKRYVAVSATLCSAASCSGASHDSGTDGAGPGNYLGASSGQSSGGAASASGGTGAVSTVGTAGSGSLPVSSGGGGSSSTTDTTDTALECPGIPVNSGGQAGDANSACVGVSMETEAVPVDLFIMMDRSVSMNEIVPGTTETRWEALRAAVEQFVQAVNGSTIRAGIGFFNRSGARDDDIDCNPTTYAIPTVEIGDLSDVGMQLTAAIDATPPGGLTPTLPALEGALQHTVQWATAHPGHATSVVLVTDGFPTQCQSPVSIPDIAAVASAARDSAPFVRTFVIGLAAAFNLDSIALAGGTRHAYLVDEGNANVSTLLAQTLTNISDSRVVCDYDIPAAPSPGQVVDFDQVQLVYTPASGAAEQVPRIESLDACGRNPNGGWYYDDPSNPTRISVCPCTCARFGAGRVDLELGCEPYIGLR
jgi:hypothetical protein